VVVARLREATTLTEMMAAANDVLADAVGAQAAAWSTVDPTTTLSTSCLLFGELDGADLGPDSARELRLFELEWLDDDPNTFWDMARAGRSAAGLVADVGDPRGVRRYAELLEPLGVRDELRITFRLEGRPWGTAILYRSRGGAFTVDEVALAAQTADVVATGIRQVLLRAVMDTPRIDLPPGSLLLTDDGDVVSSSVAAEALLAGHDESAIRVTLRNLAVAARGEAVAVQSTTAEGVLRFHASPAKGTDRAIAVVVEQPRPLELAPLIMLGLGLTPREREVTEQLLLGRDRRGIARTTGVTEATLGDHLKRIYRKAGVSGRSELAALLFGSYYREPRAEGRLPGPYGYFVDA
jgi:DNA-binding CsgD family transcriptional regulator